MFFYDKKCFQKNLFCLISVFICWHKLLFLILFYLNLTKFLKKISKFKNFKGIFITFDLADKFG